MSLTFLTQLHCLFVLQTLQPRLLFRAKSGKGKSVRLLLSDFVLTTTTTNFIENWKITNYITFLPANSL